MNKRKQFALVRLLLLGKNKNFGGGHRRVPKLHPAVTVGEACKYYSGGFDVLLTMHLSIFTLVINQLEAQNLFYNKFISCFYMFRAPCAHCQVSSHL